MLSKIPDKYSSQKDKFKIFISEVETLDKEINEPIRKRIEENIQQFFKKKGKLIPISQ
jgi:hypothetical protein